MRRASGKYSQEQTWNHSALSQYSPWITGVCMSHINSTREFKEDGAYSSKDRQLKALEFLPIYGSLGLDHNKQRTDAENINSFH